MPLPESRDPIPDDRRCRVSSDDHALCPENRSPFRKDVCPPSEDIKSQPLLGRPVSSRSVPTSCELDQLDSALHWYFKIDQLSFITLTVISE